MRATDVAVDRESRRARGPERRDRQPPGTGTPGEPRAGVSSRSGSALRTAARARPADAARGGRAARSGLLPQAEHEAVATARARPRTEAGRPRHGPRRGVEGTISQGVRALGPRRARRRGLAEAGLPSILTAAAIALDRLAARLANRPPAPTRPSRLAAPAASNLPSPTASVRFNIGISQDAECARPWGTPTRPDPPGAATATAPAPGVVAARHPGLAQGPGPSRAARPAPRPGRRRGDGRGRRAGRARPRPRAPGRTPPRPRGGPAEEARRIDRGLEADPGPHPRARTHARRARPAQPRKAAVPDPIRRGTPCRQTPATKAARR